MDKFIVPKLFAVIFNKLPIRLRQTKTWSFYFSDCVFSCIKYKSFDGWYWAGKEEFWNLVEHQLNKIKMEISNSKERIRQWLDHMQ